MVDREVRDAVAESFLQKLPPELVDRLLAAGERTDHPAGTILYRDSWPARAFLIIGGMVRAYIESPEGRQVTLNYARRPEVMGTRLAIGARLDLVLQTLESSSVFTLDITILREAAQRDVRVAWALIEQLRIVVEMSIIQHAINAFGSVKQRVAWHLLDLGSSHPPRAGLPLSARVSQQDLADAVGSVREVVARVLREFREARLIRTLHGRIVILDAAGLYAESWQTAELARRLSN